MNSRLQLGCSMIPRVTTLSLFACLINLAGCSSEAPTNNQDSIPSTEQSSSLADGSHPLLTEPNSFGDSAGGSQAIGAPIPAPETAMPGTLEPLPASELLGGEGMPSLAADNTAASSPPRNLRPNFTPQELVDFLAGADQDMQQIYSGAAGIRDNNVALSRMREIGKLKLEASKRLRDHADVNKEQQVEAARGVLQSLSHLAALGDLDSANELEELATQNLQADDPRIVIDSQLVLIGFAIESLEHGKDGAAAKIIKLVEALKNSSQKQDVPTMMVLGQARQMLSQYGHDEEADLIRQTIIDLFSGAEDPQIASMAAQLAGSIQFDAIDQMLATAIEGGNVSVARWKDEAQQLIDASADIMTVQYLAGAALEFEATDRDDLAEATYGLLRDRFGDQADQLGDEARIAIDARDARRNVVGLVFDPALSQIDGSPLSMSQFSGKIVLMPFWASGFPQSLQILPLLLQIRDSHPDKVVIVGMNLDPEDAPTQDFVDQNQLDFPSYQSVSSPTARVVNSVATRFGMVSMPFVAVLDQQGRVTAIDFKGQKLKQIVDELISR